MSNFPLDSLLLLFPSISSLLCILSYRTLSPLLIIRLCSMMQRNQQHHTTIRNQSRKPCFVRCGEREDTTEEVHPRNKVYLKFSSSAWHQPITASHLIFLHFCTSFFVCVARNNTSLSLSSAPMTTFLVSLPVPCDILSLSLANKIRQPNLTVSLMSCHQFNSIQHE